MKFGIPWSNTKGIRPEARETATEAARRAGMSLDDWLNSIIFQQAAQGEKERPSEQPDRRELAAVNQRLDELTHRIEQVTGTGPAAYAPKHHRDQSDERAELIGRLDQHLDAARSQQTTEPQRQPPPMPRVTMPPALERALAEISARQQVLKGEASRRRQQLASPAPRATAPHGRQPARSALPTHDLSGLEAQLRKITDQIETLRRPGVEEAINALRAELGEIGHALGEAMPRQAINTIERQIKGLAQRIIESRQNGIDRDALTGLERGLGDVRDALQHLTPAEKLVGFNEAIASLAQKIDLIVAEKDPATLARLESAITTLRGMADHVASNDAVTALAGEVQALAEKVDYLARNNSADALSSLERRIDALAHALAERAHNGDAVPPRLEALVESLSDKIEQIQDYRGDNVAVSALEERIAAFVHRLDESDSRLGQLEAIERGLADLLVHIQDMQANRDATIAPAPDSFALDVLKQDLALSQDALKYDIAQGQDALKHDLVRSQDTIKDDIARAQNTLSEVHGTLGQLVDRLAAIEQDIRSERPARSPGMAEPLDLDEPARQFDVRMVDDAPAMQAPIATDEEQPEAVAAAGGRGTAWTRPTSRLPSAPQLSQVAPAERAAFTRATPAADTRHPHMTRQDAVSSELQDDQPLEPGSGPPPVRANAAARIAASEAALGNAAPAVPANGGKSNFIAAARRAAQAAVQQEAAAQAATDGSPKTGDASKRARGMRWMKSLLVAASVVAIVLGSVQVASNMLHWGKSNTPRIAKEHRAASKAAPARVALSSPEKLVSKPTSVLTAAPIASIDLLAPPNETVQIGSAPASSDITGSIPQPASPPPSHPAAGAPSPAISAPSAGESNALPVAIGSKRLRDAAAAGDAAAAYEVAVRYAEGRGVPVNLPAAAQWYERAAKQGLAPAQFRFASLLEKGQGVKKDLGHARKLYLAAAAQGNAKSMHNLAVLYAEGIDGKPDYKTAAKWFRKAAQHGVSDSQYNLGILCARGIGTDKDLIESYKWFALAAGHGDKEAAKKRDKIASQLDPKQLAAARSAVEHFKVEPQPIRADTVPVPPGGWDIAAAAPRVTAQAAPSHTVGKH